MKQKIYLLMILLINASFLHAQTWQWIQKNYFPGLARYSTGFFTVNGKGYMGVGNNNNYGMEDFWQYNPLTDSWTQKADFIGYPTWSTRGFSVGTDGYFFSGAAIYQSDLYKYNTLTNAWTLVNYNCPLLGRQDAFSFEINGKGYITCGYSNFHLDDLWEYNPVSNTWTQKANFPGGARDGVTGFVIGTDAYMGLGLGATTYNDFYKYNSILNSWSTISSFPGATRHSAVSFSLSNGKGYTGMGVNSGSTFYNDFYEYDPINDVWTASASFFNWGISYPFVFQFANTAFIGNGWEQSSNFTNTVYQFTTVNTGLIETANKDLFNVYPNPFLNEVVITFPPVANTNLTIKVFDMQGKIVSEEKTKNNSNHFRQTLNLNYHFLPSGTYFLQLTTSKDIFMRKIVKL